MGCDGGSIPTRRELVREKEKPSFVEKSIQNDIMLSKWIFCRLSKEPLRSPVVSCQLGGLYNKESVLKFLINREKFQEWESIIGHVKSLKDFTELNLTKNPSSNEDSSELSALFICPITRQEMNGKSKFIFLKTCGCVFSKSALSEFSNSNCLLCNKAFETKDIIPINGSPEEISLLKQNIIDGAKHLGKQKKRKLVIDQ